MTTIVALIGVVTLGILAGKTVSDYTLEAVDTVNYTFIQK